MAIEHYESVNGIARKIIKAYDSVNGVARNRVKAYDGVNGVARLFFAPDDGGAVVLEVEKVTSDTYANNTTYTAEEFILLDIYPKTGGTVNITYGGLTKTITDTSGAEEPNAQQVFFGAFNGVSDSVATPSSGELTINGDYYAFGASSYMYGSGLKSSAVCGCITAVNDWGAVETIPSSAFKNCAGMTSVSIPDTIKSIGSSAFESCTGLTSIELPNAITTIESETFYQCNGLTSLVVPNGITSIKDGAFQQCSNLARLVLPSTLQTIGNAVAFKQGVTGDVAITVEVLATTPPTYAPASGDTSTQMALVQKITLKNTIIVPKGCLSAYKSAVGWSEYAEIVNNVNQVTMKEAT